MQQGADIDNVRVIVPGLGYRFLEPVIQLGPLVWGTDILIVLHIVQDNKVGPPVSVLAPTDFLAAANGLQLDIAFCHQHIAAPHLTWQKAKILYNSGVFFKLHPDIVQKALGLFAAVRYNNGVMLILVQDGVHGALKGQVGAFCVSTGRGHHPAHTRQAADCLGVSRGQRGAAFQHPLLPDAVQLPVEVRGGAAEIVGEVGPPEKFHVNGRQPFAQAAAPGKGQTGNIIFFQLLPFRGMIPLQEIL